MKRGYVFSERPEPSSRSRAYGTLRKYFPVRRVVIKCKTKRYVYFLEGREEEAFRAYAREFGGKVVSFHRLVTASKAFGMISKEKASGIVKTEKNAKSNGSLIPEEKRKSVV